MGKPIVLVVASLLKVSRRQIYLLFLMLKPSHGQVAKRVTELYDTIEHVLVRIGDALDRFDTYLQPSIYISVGLRKSFVCSLIVMLDLIGTVTKRYNDEKTNAKALSRRLSTSSYPMSKVSTEAFRQRTSLRRAPKDRAR